MSLVSSDRLLVKRLLRGDERAFNQFFEDYFPKVFRFAMSRVGGNEDLAEELAQATLCKAMESLDRWRGEAALTTWLFTICRNRLVDMKRGRKGQVTLFSQVDDVEEVRSALESMQTSLGISPEDTSLSEELRQAVQLTLDYLPTQYATALRLKYLEGHSVRDIGERLGISSKAAESVLTRARGAFRDGFSDLQRLIPSDGQQPESSGAAPGMNQGPSS